MGNRYNLSNLEATFSKYLAAENYSRISIKNYLSDLRHFTGWVINKLRATSYELRVENIHSDVIETYKSYLSDNQTPNKTINRRLSTLRKFFSFCINQSWITDNPARNIENIGNKPKLPLQLTQFKTYLISKGVKKPIIAKYLNNLEEFYQFVQSAR